MENVDWGPSLVVLAVGLLGGAIAAWRIWTSGRVPSASDTAAATRDLRAKIDVLLRQLRELAATPDKRSPEQLASERYALELEAARVLQALERSDAAAPAPEPAAATIAAPGALGAPPSGDRAALRGFLWGTGTMAAAGLLLFFVSQAAHERREGGTVTGNLPGEEQRPMERASEDHAGIAELEAAVARSPDDVEARLALARAHLGRQDLMAVWNETKAVLERSPGEPRALSYQGLVRLAMGQGELAVQMVEQAMAKRPDFLEGYLHLAIVYARTGRASDAEAAIERAVRRFPEEEAQLRELGSTILRSAPTGASAELSDPHTQIAPPAGVGAGRAPQSPRAAADPEGVSGTIDVVPALRGKVGGVLFVMLRREGTTGGPPLAAKRLVVSSFPIPFQIGAADSMMGEKLPDTFRVEARLDTDGDPASKDPSDPAARRAGVRKGTGDVALVLESAR
jgi:Flp pilus assembly protein TadD